LRYSIAIHPSGAAVRLGKAPHQANIAIEYLNSNRFAKIQPLDPKNTRASEFIGRDPARWRTNIPTFGRIMEEGLYPGIDLVYYGSGAGMEYDFVVAPGSDPGRIRMRVGGAQKLVLNTDGDLVVRTASGDLVQHRPLVYQTVEGARRTVDGGFVIANDVTAGVQVSFRVGRYDRSLPLTIDPQISFSSFLGDFDEDVALSVAVDNAGNTYVAGYSTSNNLGGDEDVMVASIDPTGKTLNYIAQASGSFGIGGSSDDVANGIAVDGYGSAVIVGSTTSADFPTTQNSFQPAGGGGDYDAFLMRLDPTGQNLIYATYLGGSGDDEAWSVKIDATGNTYLTGDTTSNDFPATTGAYRTTNSGATDGFIARFDNTGNRIWATYFGGNSDENSYSIAIDPAGNSYVTGFTDSGNFPTQNAFQGTYRGGDDAFVLKLNSSERNWYTPPFSAAQATTRASGSLSIRRSMPT